MKWNMSQNHINTQSQEHVEGSLTRPGPARQGWWWHKSPAVRRVEGEQIRGFWVDVTVVEAQGPWMPGWRVGWVFWSWALKEELNNPLWNTWAGVKPLWSEVLASCIIDLMDLGLRKLQEMVKPGMWQSMGSQRIGHDWATEQHQQPGFLPTRGFVLCLLRPTRLLCGQPLRNPSRVILSEEKGV